MQIRHEDSHIRHEDSHEVSQQNDNSAKVNSQTIGTKRRRNSANRKTPTRVHVSIVKNAHTLTQQAPLSNDQIIESLLAGHNTFITDARTADESSLEIFQPSIFQPSIDFAPIPDISPLEITQVSLSNGQIIESAPSCISESLEPKQKKSHANKITVLKGTAIEFDPQNEEQQSQETEEISKRKFFIRKKMRNKIRVLKGTATPFDPENAAHQGQETEEITKRSLSDRKHTRKYMHHKIRVLKGTATLFDPENASHQGQETEEITKKSLSNRKYMHHKIRVLEGTTTPFDPENAAHQGQETEEITKKSLSNRKFDSSKYRRSEIRVLKGTVTPFDPENAAHQGQETEEITKSVFNNRKSNGKKVTVLKNTAIEFNPENIKHQNKETEQITKSAFHSRKRRQRVKTSSRAAKDPVIEKMSEHPLKKTSSKESLLEPPLTAEDQAIPAGIPTETPNFSIEEFLETQYQVEELLNTFGIFTSANASTLSQEELDTAPFLTL